MNNSDQYFSDLLGILNKDPFDAFLTNDDDDDDLSFITASDGPTTSEYLENITQLHPSSFHFAQINAQSLMSHTDYLTYVFGNQKIHVIGVSESWLKPSLNSSLVALPGYTLYRNDRVGKGGGGVAAYIREGIKVKVLESSPGQYNHKTEYLFLELSLFREKLLLGIVYKPPLVDLEFSDYEPILFRLASKYDHILIGGDHNSDILADKICSKNLRSLYDTCNLHILPLSPTHHKSVLDLLITRDLKRVKCHGQFPAPGFSHHDLVHMSYSLKPPKFEPKILTYRNFRGLDTEALHCTANTIPWMDVEHLESTEEKVIFFNSLFTNLYDQHAPLVTRRVTHPPAPWLNAQIKELMRSRDKVYKKFRRSRTESLHQKYKSLRNKVNQAIRNAKLRYAHSLSSVPGKQLWSRLRKLGVKSEKKSCMSHFDLNALNQHFATTVPQPSLACVTQSVSHVLGLPRFLSPEFSFQPVTEAVVSKSITSIKSNAQGNDCISKKMILLVLDIILPCVTHIFNSSILSGTFPQFWKTSILKPLPKKDKPMAFNDLRPISLLPVLSKALEKIISDQINNHFIEYTLLDPFQSGYKKNCSTTTAVLNVVNDLTFSADSGRLSILVLLDFSKAFDSVNFDVLLAKMIRFNFSPNAISWLKTYLSGRDQIVNIDNNYSTSLPVPSGVPQGSVLGPLLFAIYLTDLPECLSHCRYHFYCDDLQIYLDTTPTDFPQAIDLINEDLKSISQWCTTNFLSLNPSKCQVLVVGFPKSVSRVLNNNPKNVVLDNNAVPFEKKVVNDLGILVDSNLTWHEHVQRTCKQVFFSLHSLNRFRNIFPIELKKKLIQNLVLPIYDYGDILYNACSETDKKRLQYSLNCCVRFIFRVKKSEHVTPLYKQLNWLKLKERRSLHLLLLLYKMIHNSSAGYLNNKPIPLCSDRNGIILNVSHHKTALCSNSFMISAAREWNNLPKMIRDINVFVKFKKELFKHYLDAL